MVSPAKKQKHEQWCYGFLLAVCMKRKADTLSILCLLQKRNKMSGAPLANVALCNCTKSICVCVFGVNSIAIVGSYINAHETQSIRSPMLYVINSQR